ncbi:MAG: hypothetical protein ACYCS7_14255 [Acidimicrobiales bacterium]
MAPDKRQQLINFVGQRILVVVDTAPPFVGQQVPTKVGLRASDGSEAWFEEAQSLGVVLADDAGFQALELGTWLNSPDGAFIAEAVGQVLSPAFRPEYQLVVDGLKFAANHQRVAGWQRGVGVVVLTALLGCGLWLSGRD